MKEPMSWKRMQEGDKKALAEIYSTHVESLFDYGKKITRDESIIEDCIQNLFIDLWQKRSRLSIPKNVKGYLLLSLKRRIIRESNRHQAISVSDQEMEFFLEASVDTQSQIIDEEIQTEKLGKLNQSLKKLSSRQKEIIYLKFSKGLSNQEIADMLEMNNQSVRNAIHRSINKLKNMILSILL